MISVRVFVDEHLGDGLPDLLIKDCLINWHINEAVEFDRGRWSIQVPYRELLFYRPAYNERTQEISLEYRGARWR